MIYIHLINKQNNEEYKMKYLFLVTVFAAITSTTSTSKAMVSIHPDAFRDIMICQPVELRPDMGMEVKVNQGGIAGITQVIITRYFLGHSTTSTHIVKRIQLDKYRPGAAVVYVGQNVRLSINYTTTPNKDGGHASTLELVENEQVSAEQLSCQTIYTVQSALE